MRLGSCLFVVTSHFPTGMSAPQEQELGMFPLLRIPSITVTVVGFQQIFSIKQKTELCPTEIE